MAGERILVVDDEPHIRKLLHRYLSGAGYTTGLAADGLEALQLVREHVPDLVITDVNMPNMNGLELTRQLRTSHKTAGVPILMLSAEKQESDVLTGYAQGADDYVGKPVELAILKVKIELLLRRAGPAAGAAVEPGRLILLMHGKGGVGATTLAVNCAVAATSRSPERVGILDLNLVFGNADILLDIRDPRPLSDLAQMQGEIDDPLFDTFVAPHPTGARLVVANRIPESAELVSLAAVQLAIDRLRRRCDLVLVDLPANFSEHTLTAIDSSSVACIVTSPRLASMKAAGDCLETLRKIGYPRRQVLLVENQVAEIADRAHFATFFGQPPDAVISRSQLFETAADSGSPVMVKFPGSEAAAEVAALAQVLAAASGDRAPAAAAS